MESDGHQVLDSLFEVPYKIPLQNLAKSIELLDKADMVVFYERFSKFKRLFNRV